MALRVCASLCCAGPVNIPPSPSHYSGTTLLSLPTPCQWVTAEGQEMDALLWLEEGSLPLLLTWDEMLTAWVPARPSCPEPVLLPSLHLLQNECPFSLTDGQLLYFFVHPSEYMLPEQPLRAQAILQETGLEKEETHTGFRGGGCDSSPHSSAFSVTHTGSR